MEQTYVKGLRLLIFDYIINYSNIYKIEHRVLFHAVERIKLATQNENIAFLYFVLILLELNYIKCHLNHSKYKA